MSKNFKMSKADERRLAKQAQTVVDDRLAKAAKLHPIQQSDTEAEIERKLIKQLEAAGLEPNTRGVRERAREIAKQNSQG